MNITSTEHKRRRIIDAALEVFSSKGFHNATISEVATTAHVGKGTVYLYFAGKEALLVSIFDELADHIVRIFDQIVHDGVTLQDVVQRVVSREIEAGRTKAQILQILAQQPFLSTLSLQREKGCLIERVIDKIAARVRVAIDDGALRACDPILAACLLLSLPGALSLYAAACADSGLPESLPAVAQDLAEMMWLGFRKDDQ